MGPEYVLDRFGYVVRPPWRDRDLALFASGVGYDLGSVTGSEFTIEGRFAQTADLGSGVAFRYLALQSEHRDTRFLRNTVELECRGEGGGGGVAPFVQAELFAEKESIDASLGAWLARTDDAEVRAMVTLVDAPNGKSERIDVEVDPIGVLLSGACGRRGAHRVAFELAGQLPFRVRDLDEGARLGMYRWLLAGQARAAVGAEDWLIAAAELEWTDKDYRPDAAGDPREEEFGRDYQQVRLEWWRDVEPVPWSVGVVFTHMDELGRRPNDPANSLAIRRQEWMAVGRLQWPTAACRSNRRCSRARSHSPRTPAAALRRSDRTPSKASSPSGRAGTSRRRRRCC
jgi:hypothetical protein